MAAGTAAFRRRVGQCEVLTVRKAARRWLYLGHRWFGITLSLFFAIWFASGIVMMYVPFPSFRAPERIAGSPPIAWDKVKVDPGAALATLRLAAFPKEMRMGMTAGEPVYRFVTEDGHRAVSAATGREISEVSATQAKAIASSFVHAPVLSARTIEHDQWVVTKSYVRLAPFWRVRMADDAATEVYVIKTTGEIVQNTTAFERGWNWVGSIPHWIYFEALRLRQEAWRQVLLWISGLGILGGATGIWIGILRVRLRQRYRSGSVSPYRGWMKWHHLAGMVGGLFLMGWVFSGWLSMSPWGGLHDKGLDEIAARFDRSRPDFPAFDSDRMAAAGHDVREVSFTYIGGRPAAILIGADGTRKRIDGATGAPFVLSDENIAAIARNALPQARLESVERLTRYDSYWYAKANTHGSEHPLPILRFRLADATQTWLHIDPATGELRGVMGRGARADRWLFSALHCFDLPLLLEHRPLRDGLMWLLSAFGLIISVSGVVIGWRRLTSSKARRNPL